MRLDYTRILLFSSRHWPEKEAEVFKDDDQVVLRQLIFFRPSGPGKKNIWRRAARSSPQSKSPLFQGCIRRARMRISSPVFPRVSLPQKERGGLGERKGTSPFSQTSGEEKEGRKRRGEKERGEKGTPASSTEYCEAGRRWGVQHIVSLLSVP